MPRKKTYTDEEFIEAIKTSRSLRQALEKLNLKPAGGNYRVAKQKIIQLKIDDSHLDGKGWSKGKTLPSRPRKTLEDLLTKDSYTSSNKLRIRLLRDGIFEQKCYNCELKQWNGETIPLELEHINGDNLDNRIENLTLLCPNCHAQTSTYRGKNKKTTKKSIKIVTDEEFKDIVNESNTLSEVLNKLGLIARGSNYKTIQKRLASVGLLEKFQVKNEYNICCNCGLQISAKRKFCTNKCSNKFNAKNHKLKIIWPSFEVLKEMVNSNGYLKTGRILGVSDNAVRKHLLRYENLKK